MAAIEIGYAGKVMVAADTSGTAGTFSALGAQSKGEITPKVNTADVTQTNQGGFDMYVPTTKGADIKCSAYFLSGGADAGYVILLGSYNTGANMWIKVYRDATIYNLAYCFCTSVPSKIDPKNPNMVDFGLQFSGNPNGYTINNGLTGSPYAATVILGVA